MKNKKVIVTGGTGYIGSHTAIALYESGYIPVIIDNLHNSSEDVLNKIQNITGKEPIFYKEDCCITKNLEKIIKKEGVSGIIHFAAYKMVGESVEKPLKYYDNNLNSTLSVLRAINNTGVKNFVFSSSCSVYGNPEKCPVSERSPVKHAESPYAWTKYMGEILINDTTYAQKQLKAIQLRYFNPIGAHPSGKLGESPLGEPENLVPFITQTAAGKRDHLIVFGNDYKTRDGTCIRDYIHVMDIAEAHIHAFEWLQGQNELSIPEVFNIGIGEGRSVLELISSFKEVNGVDVPYKIGNRREGDVEQIWADSEKAANQMGWQPRYSISQALKHAWQWEKNNF